MKLFFVCYGLIVISVAALIFYLSKNEETKPKAKTVMTIVYILSLIALFLGMAVMEGRYKVPMLYSSVITFLALGVIYAADRLGGKLSKKDDNNDN